MTTTGCGHDRAELALFVLGALDGADLDDIDARLSDCPACAATFTELADLPALLDLIAEAPADPPGRLRDRVVADFARRAERRHRSAWIAVAAVIALLAGIGVGQLRPPAPEPIVAIPVDAVDPYTVAGQVRFATADDGLVVALELNGLDPLPDEAAYEAWLYTDDHRIVSIGQLEPVDGRVDTELLVAGDPDQFTGFWITAEPDRRDPAHQGPTVVRAPVPRW